MADNKPNFFIVGAPKCGTTSMQAWLSEHKQVFIPSPEELHFFNTDMSFRAVHALADYSRIFSDIGPQFMAIGECSVFYLYSENAVRNILNFQPEAKFIVMLRNPVEVAQSLHSQFRYDDMEPIEDFEEAWTTFGEDRPVGNRCPDPSVLNYMKVVSFGAQVQRLTQVAPVSSVLYVFMDDLRNDPLHEYRRVLDFLGISYDGRVNFEVHNASKMFRSRLLNRARTFAAKLDKRYFPSRARKFLAKLNSRPFKRLPLREGFRLQVIDQLQDDILLLSNLVKRDLSDWLR